MSDQPQSLRGTLSVHPRGFGFVQAPDGVSAFVPPPLLRGYLAGDGVVAEVKLEADGRRSCSSLERTSRWRERLCGTVRRGRGGLVLEPDPQVSNAPWPLEAEPAPPQGAWVIAELAGEGARLLSAIPEDERELTVLLERWGVRRGHPEPAGSPSEVPFPGRRDLREVPTLTIDAPSSRDLDDALSAFPADAEGAV